MPKADIVTNTGTKISIEGSVEEISAILSLYNSPNPQLAISTKTKSTESNNKNDTGTPATLVGYVLELRDTGFFDTPKKTTLVKERLELDGHFYPMQSVSTCLINRNARKELGRVKEGTKWAYVKR